MLWGALSSVVDATVNGQVTARSIAPDIQVTDSLDDVLRNDQIQGVALATPAETHADLAIHAMQAGKDIFVEKPMALTVEDAEKMKKGSGKNRSHSYGRSSLGIPPCGSQTSRIDCFGRVRQNQLYLLQPFELWEGAYRRKCPMEFRSP